jgi:hypothetical protein
VLALGGIDSKTLNNLGYLTVDRATYLARVGRDPRPAIAEGLGFLQRALAANRSERFAYFNTAGLRLIESEYLVETGQDPTDALAAVQDAIDADLKRSENPDPDILAYRCNAHVLAARWAMARKESPAEAFAAADVAMKKAEQLDATTGYVVDARVGLERWRAEWLVSEGRDASAALSRARSAASQVVEMVHNAPGARRLVGEVALVEARSVRDLRGPDAAKRRADALATARRELQAALVGNRFLERELAPLLAELDAP